MIIQVDVCYNQSTFCFKMARGKQISPEIRSLVLLQSSKGSSQRNIAQILNLSRGAVQSVLRLSRSKNSIRKNKKRGRPSLVSNRDIRHLKSVVQKNRRKTTVEIRALWNQLTRKNLSVTTTKKFIHKIGFGFYKVRELETNY